MSRTVSFRCSEELDEFLEREAERRMTTKSTVAQLIVADYAAKQTYDADTDADPVAPPEVEKDVSAGVNIGEDTTVEFPSKTDADAFRDEYETYVDRENDDMRLKRVAVTADTPREILPQAASHEGEQTGSSESGG